MHSRLLRRWENTIWLASECGKCSSFGFPAIYEKCKCDAFSKSPASASITSQRDNTLRGVIELGVSVHSHVNYRKTRL